MFTGPETSYRQITTNRFALAADIDLDHVAYDAASDGCFPLITNDANMSDAHVLAAYRYQPNLERRHHLLKSVQDAAPVLLNNPARIEALFCCQLLALLVAALIEAQVRTAMAAAALNHIPLYPELRDCTAPSNAADPGDLHQPRPPPTAPRRRPRADLRTRTHHPAATDPRPTRPRAHRLHAAPIIAQITRTRCAERQSGDRRALLLCQSICAPDERAIRKAPIRPHLS